MINLTGKYVSAKIFTTNVEDEALAQVQNLLDQPFVKGSKVRMMPDIHSGKGCVIGTTMTIEDSVVPNLVGVDIGCGVSVFKFKADSVDFEKLDRVIRENIPWGFNVNATPVCPEFGPILDNLICINTVNKQRVMKSLRTLGGGNHYVELGKDGEGYFYLTIHSGSRGLGTTVAKHYQDIAIEECTRPNQSEEIKKLIASLKAIGRQYEIPELIAELKASVDSIDICEGLEYLTGPSMANYLHDVNIAQAYARKNRELMQNIIAAKMGWTALDEFQTIHNYIDFNTKILRKGAVSANLGEKLVIPINMRDGCLICEGKGNSDWNYSAPHGVGRLMSRTKAKADLDINMFKEQMSGVWSSTVSVNTLDEAPGAYKPMQEIIDNIQDTVQIIKHITPVYNFKAE